MIGKIINLKLFFLFLKGFSTKKNVNTESTIKIMIMIISLQKLSEIKPVYLILEKENIGQCHKYKEYEIKPTPTNGLDDKILVIKLFSDENQIIIQVPIITGKVNNDGCGIPSL